MTQDFSSSIVLTYKNKVLLLSQDIDEKGTELSLWSFIGGKKRGTESHEQTVRRRVKYNTNLELKEIKCLQSKTRGRDYYYHGRLSDFEVNHIERREGERLEFYTLKEVDALTLSEKTQDFWKEFKDNVEELMV